MDYIAHIKNYKPINEQEQVDKEIILDMIEKYPHNILLRENKIAHITSSGFILNKDLKKALFIHHNIYDKWAWTGGHADGNPDLLAISLKEAIEETGIKTMPISNEIASLDVLTVPSHYKNDEYVNSHLHLSIAYVLMADETEAIRIQPSENSDIKWFDISEITKDKFPKRDIYLYNKLIEKARGWF